MSVPGGFIENPLEAEPRPRLTRQQIRRFVPNGKGKFRFPAPYKTIGYRLTDNSVTVRPVGYSYWRVMNNHVGQDEMKILCFVEGKGPSIITFNKVNETISDPVPIFPSNSSWAAHKTQDWYFSGTQPNVAYAPYERSLYRIDVTTGEREVVVNVKEALGGDYKLGQCHSSDDDKVHSGTLKTRNYNTLGAWAFNEETGKIVEKRAQGFDECQIDKSGRYLLIKANIDGKQGEDNIVIDLETGEEQTLLDPDGAAGHSDNGYGYMVNADNYSNDANTRRLTLFDDLKRGKLLYHNNDWGVSAPGHISHLNAREDVPPEKQFVLGSSSNAKNSVHANEIIAVPLDGSMRCLVIAPTLTDVRASGGGTSYYKHPFANVDITGEWALWSSNSAGSRLDWYVARIPVHKLDMVEPYHEQAPAPAPHPEPEHAAEPVDVLEQRVAELEERIEAAGKALKGD